MPDETLARERCRDLFDQAAGAARECGVTDVEVIFAGGAHALTRFANNRIHQNVAERSHHISVRAQIGKRTARATTNRLDRESVRRAVGEAIAITRLQEEDPELPDLAGAAEYPELRRAFQGTAGASPKERADAVAAAIDTVAAAGQTAAGIFSTGESIFAVFNTRGVAAWHRETMAQFSITAMAADSSGWAKASACYHRDLQARELARIASRKAAQSAAPRELPPGRYTVILEPAAALDLVGQMFPDFSATAVRDGRSFLNDRLGKTLFGENVTIYDDVTHPLQAGAPFDGEGVPRKRLILVDRGAVRDIAYSRQAAQASGVSPTGHAFPVPNEYGEAPVNIVIQGGGTPLEQMIASTPRGILVTRLWYIREVDPYEKIFTGMTRDGTFLIEGGEIAGAVRNFRFNQNLLEFLRNVEALSPAARASGEEAFDLVAPAMKVSGFNFTEVTRF